LIPLSYFIEMDKIPVKRNQTLTGDFQTVLLKGQEIPLPARPAAGGAAVSNRRLADAIERDLLRERPATPEPQTCFACGRSYSRGAPKADSSSESRFCSVRCQDAFDTGFPPYDPNQARTLMQVPLTAWIVVAGPPGTVGTRPHALDLPIRGDGCLITCKGCQREFVSKGLRCCSPECEKRYRERLEIEATLREVGAEAAPKRRCEACGAVIPRWTKGRRQVKKTVRFCSAKCQQKAKRQSGATQGQMNGETAQKPPSNGPLPEPVQFPSVPAEASVLAVPIDIIGGGSFRFEGSGLDRVIVRTIFSTELPATVTPNSGERAKDAALHRSDRTIENGRQTRSGTPPIAPSDRAVTSLPETEPVTSEPAGALATTDDEP
jgi:hypothetical protein